MFCEHRISKNGTTIPGENTGLVFCELLITLCQLIKINLILCVFQFKDTIFNIMYY